MTEGNGEGRELPKGWTSANIGSFGEVITGSTPPKKDPSFFGGTIPFYKPTDLDAGYAVIKAREYLSELGASQSRIIPAFSLLVTCIGATIGKTGLTRIKCATNQQINAVILPLNYINPKWLFWMVSSAKGRQMIIDNSSATTMPILNKSRFSELSFPIPPFQEQERTVEKIEELFSDIDQGVESLKTAQKQLKVYRQAVLKWAFEGKLTEEWRKQQTTLKTGEALLAQIKSERFSNYQGKYNEPILPKSKSFQEIPEDWCLVTIDQISTFLTSGSRGWAQYYSDSGSYFIRAQDINTDKLKLEKVAYVNLPRGVEGERTQVQVGDILITMTGANVTKTALVHITLNKEAYVNQHVGLVRLIEPVSRKFIYWWLVSSQHGRAQLTTAAYGAGKPGLNLTNLKEVLITLPSIEEQEQIVEEIESRLSICDQLEVTIIENLQKAEALRQSILKQAFEGKLVPQDPNDEPAEKLLERIKAERQANGNTEKKAKPSHQQLTLQEL